MAAKKFGYVRVSTREQNPDRQIYILRDEEGIDERDIYVEKESGRQFERPVYRSLVDNILREGDLLVVTKLKRFGRNYGEIYKEWFRITKEIGADIKVTSMPILDTTQSKELVGQLITDVVLAVFAYVADEDWTERHELQRQGIEEGNLCRQHFHKFLLSQDFNAELLCLCQLAACLFAADQVIRLFGDGVAGRGAEADNLGVDPVAGEVLKLSGCYDGASCKCVVRCFVHIVLISGCLCIQTIFKV